MEDYPRVIHEKREEIVYRDYKCILLVKEYDSPPLRFSGEIVEIFHKEDRLVLKIADTVALPGDSEESVIESCRENFFIWLSRNTEEDVFFEKR